ncbi:vesicle transport through interaction with t-SNAREs homolog 1A isoform X1 [Gambusia affinis]|uniref:vesicle transport through interaction with t-SNAREs homolog 1A isoform X1 n=1 Tax=Gambusia affinis TaxID=33528 RepID=UPI001CDC3BFF|nr:vesicle transport through interaction with t-SNAREs homolog 1A isoform X1 [Gambusia affinis]
MSSDFETYEQDFGTITAEVTNKIGKIPKLSGEEKTQLVLNVDKQLEEVKELLEQMDLEVREIPIQSRAMYNSRLKSYKQEVEKLEKDFAKEGHGTRFERNLVEKRKGHVLPTVMRCATSSWGMTPSPRRARERICWTTQKNWKGHLGDWRPAIRLQWKLVTVTKKDTPCLGACRRKKCSIDLCLTQRKLREERETEKEGEREENNSMSDGGGERAKTTTVKSRIGLKKNSFRRKWETKARTRSPPMGALKSRYI